MSSAYFQSLTFFLYEKGLLSDELKAVLHEHDDIFSNKLPVQITFGIVRKNVTNKKTEIQVLTNHHKSLEL
jgi:hypothetical protein